MQTTTFSLASLGLAGCSGVTNRDFTAEQAAIPDDARSELGYTEQRSEETIIEKSRAVAGRALVGADGYLADEELDSVIEGGVAASEAVELG